MRVAGCGEEDWSPPRTPYPHHPCPAPARSSTPAAPPPRLSPPAAAPPPPSHLLPPPCAPLVPLAPPSPTLPPPPPASLPPSLCRTPELSPPNNALFTPLLAHTRVRAVHAAAPLPVTPTERAAVSRGASHTSGARVGGQGGRVGCQGGCGWGSAPRPVRVCGWRASGNRSGNRKCVCVGWAVQGWGEGMGGGGGLRQQQQHPTCS